MSNKDSRNNLVRNQLEELMKRSMLARDLRHIDEFMRLYASPKLLSLRLFPNAKEVSESFAAFAAVRQYMNGNWSFDDGDTLCISIADGHKPRTASIFHEMTKWRVISADPNMREDVIEAVKEPLPRLTALKCMAAELPKTSTRRLVICAVHAHNYNDKKAPGAKTANILVDVLNKVIVEDEILIVALPCCHDLRIPGNPENNITEIFEYNDPGIWSVKNLVRVWKVKR